MTPVWLQLLPLVLGAVLAPVWVIIVLLLLAGPQGRLKAAAFVLGMTATRLLQGALFGLVFGASPDAAADADGSSPVTSTLLVVVGIFLLITSFRTWRKVEDPDAPPPQWMQSLDQTTPLKAFGLGAAGTGIAVKLWVFTLSAIGVISAAELGVAGGITAYLLYVLLAQSLLIAPIIIAVVAPRASQSALQGAISWLTRYNRPITIAVTLIFGVYFLYDGLKGLLT